MSLHDRFRRFVASAGYRDLAVERAERNRLIAPDGSDYVDFIAGWCVVNVGYDRTAILDAQREAAERVPYIKPTYASEGVAALGERLADLTPSGLEKTFRVPSGTEAVELALKAARAYTGAETIVANVSSYHGHAFGAMSAGYTALGERYRPLVPEFRKIRPPIEPDDQWYDDLDRMLAGAAAYVSETVLTHQGMHVPPGDHYDRVREICDDNDALLVLDEVANGFGRTGAMVAADRFDAEPDVMAFAKGLSSGYAPIGATVMRPAVAESVMEAGACYSTFGWTPEAVAAARASLDILEGEELPARARSKGRALKEAVESLDGVKAVRQKGLLLGVELRSGDAHAVMEQGIEHGVLTGTPVVDDTLILSPPLTLEEDDIRHGVDRLQDAIEAV